MLTQCQCNGDYHETDTAHSQQLTTYKRDLRFSEQRGEREPSRNVGERGCRGVAHAQYRFRWGWAL